MVNTHISITTTRPDEQGWSVCSFELICCYLFTRAEPVSSSWTNKNMLWLWWSQFGPTKYKETISWYWGLTGKFDCFSCQIVFWIIRRKQDRPARKKKAPFRCFLAFKHYKQYFSHCFTVDSWATMKYHIGWITTAGMTFCKMFDKSLYDYYDSFTNEGSWCLQMIYQGS